MLEPPDQLDHAGFLDVGPRPGVEGLVREVGAVAAHGGGADDDAVDEGAHPGREALDVGHPPDLPAGEHGHRAAHLEGPAQDVVVGRDGVEVRVRGQRRRDRAREAVGAGRVQGGLLGGEESRGWGGREEGVAGGGGGCGVLEAR